MIEQELADVLAGLTKLADSADRAGHDPLHSAAFGALLTLIDGAQESGVAVDTDALGFMAGSFE